MARSLTAKLVVLLTIALLPLGLISVYQTYNVASDAARLARQEMLASTMEAARAEIELINEAQGAAIALGAMATSIGPREAACSESTRRFVETDARFVFAGFIQRDGIMRCRSSGAETDFSGDASWRAFVDDPRPMLVASQNGTQTGKAVMIVSVPVFARDGDLIGAASVSSPHGLLDALIKNETDDLEVFVTEGDGTILTTSNEENEDPTFLIDGRAPSEVSLTAKGRVVQTDNGELVSAIPLIPFDIFVVGRLSKNFGPLSNSTFGVAAPLFPVAMWVASLFVAIFALERLVLRHLRVLRGHMGRFSVDNLEGSYVLLGDAPNEIVEIGNSYNALLDRVIDDTIELAEAAQEKEILLKEVHHRVKNNLQLIASILNMQLRQIGAPEVQSVLKRVQQRVMSLASIHKLLYTDTKVDIVRADLLLSEIANSALSMARAEVGGAKSHLSLAPVEMDPDQAVPLALLVTEAVTNALKYSGSKDNAEGEIHVTLDEDDAGQVTLEVRNSLAEPKEQEAQEPGTGLGSKLISAFVLQLDGQSTVDATSEYYSLKVTFPKLTQSSEEAVAA